MRPKHPEYQMREAHFLPISDCGSKSPLSFLAKAGLCQSQYRVSREAVSFQASSVRGPSCDLAGNSVNSVSRFDSRFSSWASSVKEEWEKRFWLPVIAM